MAGKSSVAPWSVKGVERPTRDLARQSAQAAGQTVGTWIEQAIRAHATLVPPPGSTPEPDAGTEILAAAQRAEVRSLVHGVERAEAQSGDMVIPVALKVQELAHRLVEIEQARVAGRARPQPASEPPQSPEAEPDRFAALHFEPEPEPERQPDPTPEPEAWPPPQAPAPAAEDFPNPVPPPDDRLPQEAPEPAPFDLALQAAEAVAETRPHRRDWAKPRARAKPPRKSLVRRVVGRAVGALLALTLGAGSAVLVLDHGELVGLPPRLIDDVAAGVDRAIREGRVLAVEGEERALRWIGDMHSLINGLIEDLSPAEPTPAATQQAEPPPVPQKLESQAVPPVTPSEAPAPAQTGALPVPAAPPPPTPPVSSPPPAALTLPPAASPPSSESSTAALPAPSPPAPMPTAPQPVPAAPPSPMASLAPAPAETPVPAAPPPAPSASSPSASPSGATSPAPTDQTAAFPTLVQPPAEAAPPARGTEDLEKSARQGDVKAQYELGVLAAQPESGAPDYGKAAYWFREAAVQGNSSAQYNLGVLYEHGLGVGQDDVRALLWYHSAAEQGHARAQYNLGVFYAQGRGIPMDYVEAQRWFKKAADQGIAKAFYNLAILAESGLGTPANPAAARALMSRAALLGDPEARQALASPGKRPPARVEAARPDAAKGEPPKPATEVIGAVQHMLAELGYDPGRIDGMLGDKTRQAIRKFQSDTGLPQTGLASDELMETLTAKVGPALGKTAPATR